MATAFNLTAQINLQGPSNLKQTVSKIKKEFAGIDTNINVKIDKRAEKSVQNVTARLRTMSSVIAQVNKNTKDLNVSLSSLSSSLGTVKSVSNTASKGIDKIADSTSSVAKEVKVARTEIEEFGRQGALAIRRFAAFSVVSGAVFKLTGAITSSFDSFVKLDRQLIRLQQVTGKTASGLRGLEKEIESLSVSLGLGADSLAETAVTLAQAGLVAEDARLALRALAKTELAPSFENIQKTTEGAIAAMRQFGIAAGELEKVLGSINAVSAQFAVESGDIIAAIQRTGGVFASASKGVSEGTDALNEFIAVFTSIRATTRESAETIATGLRTILTRVQRASTIDQLRDYGIELQDAEGKFIGAYKAIEALSAGLSGLDPRSVRFGQIVEELGGFRQIGKVIPLIQQFAVAQEALKAAQQGQGSLATAQAKAQQSLFVQIAKVRQEFDALIRGIAKSTTFQSLLKIVLSLSSAFIKLAGVFKPILPILGILGAIKGVSAVGQFATGFFGGLKKGGGAQGAGAGLAGGITGTKEKEKADAVSRAADATRTNTEALKNLTTSVNNLATKINSLGSSQKTSTILGPTGQPYKFASGGVVPGQGNRDTVPAMLTPGEFVIRKKAVETIGAGNLHKMNKYAEGGPILKENTVGLAILGRKGGGGASGLINRKPIDPDYIIKQFPKNKQPDENETLSELNKEKKIPSYAVKAEVVNATVRKELDKAIDTASVKAFNTMSTSLVKSFAGNASISGIEKIVGKNRQNFVQSLNQGVRGNLFEQIIAGIENKGKFKDDPDPQAPFDFIGPFTDPTLQAWFPNIANIKYKDGKATLKAATKQNIANKIGNEILTGSTTVRYTAIDNKIRKLIEENGGNVEGAFLKNKGVTGADLEDAVNSGKLVRTIGARQKRFYSVAKAAGGFIQKFAEGGQAEAIVNQIKEMSAIDAVDFYTNKSRRLNTYYDKGKESELNDTYKSAIKTLDQLFNDEIPSTVYSGFGASRTNRVLKDPDNLYDLENVIGNKVTFPAYFSTSEFRNVADDFSQRGGRGLNSVSEIHTKGKGIDVEAAFERAGRPLNQIATGESEYILPRGSSFRVDNAENPYGGESLEFELTQLAKGGMIQRFAEGGESKKNKEFGRMMLRMDGNEGRSYYSPNDTRTGFVQFKKWKNNLWTVGLSQATKGYGPKLYDVAMEAVTEAGGMLTSDRALVSKDAQNVWQYYFKNRGDVKKTPLDPTEWTGNYALIDPKLHGKKETWPPPTDPAWVLQSGYSKQPSIINDQNTVTRVNGQPGMSSGAAALSYFSRYANGGAAEDTVPALLTPGEFVINKKAASRIGSTTLNKMNRADKISGFNKGGPVGMIQRFAGGGGVDPLGEKFQRAVEAMELFSVKAKEAGLSVAQYQKKLANDIVKISKDLRKDLQDKKTGVRFSAIAKAGQISADPTNTQALMEARKDFIAQLSEIAPQAQKKVQQAATDIVSGLQKGLSFETIAAQSKDLSEILSKEIKEADALQEALNRVAMSAGLASDTLEELIDPKNIERQKFLDSPEAKAFGRLAEIMPDKIAQVAKSKLGQAAINIANKFSGKGLEEALGKRFGNIGRGLGGIINSLGGPAAAAGIALTSLGDQIPAIIDGLFGAGTSKDPRIAGAAGAVGGAGTGLASGALLGSQIAGPVGGLIGGIVGAIDGAFRGAWKAVEQARLNNALEKLANTALEVEEAFKKLDKEYTQENLGETFQAISMQAMSLQELGELGQVGVSGFGKSTADFFGVGGSTEARDAFFAELPKFMQNLSRMGNARLQQVSTDEINARLDMANAAGSPAERQRILAEANQGVQAYVAMTTGPGATEEDRNRAREEAYIATAISARNLDPESAQRLTQQATDDPEVRRQLAEQGERLAATESELSLKTIAMERAMRDMTTAVENQIDIYRRAQAYIQKFNEEIGLIEKSVNGTIDAIRGNAQLQEVDRTDERMLGNISAYSIDEIKGVAARTAALGGGGEQAKELESQIVGAKIIQDELPKILSNVGDGGAGEVFDKLEEAFDAAGVEFAGPVADQLRKELETRLETGRQGASKEEIASDPRLMENLSKISESALQTAIALQKAYNDALNQTIKFTNEKIKAEQEILEYQLKASKIRLDAESGLASSLGQYRTLEQMNAPVDAQIKQRTANIIPGGTTDSTELLNFIKNNTAKGGGLDTARADLEKAMAALALAKDQGGDVETAKKQVMEAEQNLADLSGQVNNARTAMEELANDGTKAANALAKIQEQERIVSGTMDFFRKAMTADQQELGEMNRSLDAYTRAISGRASGKELQNVEFRRRMFEGSDLISGMLPPEIKQMMDAQMQLKVLESTPGAGQLLDRKIPGADRTVREALEARAKGETPETEFVKAYQKAVDDQALAAENLAAASQLVVDTLNTGIQETLDKLIDFNPLEQAQQDAAADPPPPAEDREPPDPVPLMWPEGEADAWLTELGNKLGTPIKIDLGQANREIEATKDIVTALTVLGVEIAALTAAIALLNKGGFFSKIPWLKNLPGVGKGGGGAAGGWLSKIFGGGRGVPSGGGWGGFRFPGAGGVGAGGAGAGGAGASGGAAGFGLMALRGLGILEIGRGAYAGATADTAPNQEVVDNLGIFGTGLNALTGATTGNTGESWLGSMMGLDEQRSYVEGAAGNVLGTGEAIGRGAAIGSTFGGAPGAVIGGIVGAAGDLTKNLVLLGIAAKDTAVLMYNSFEEEAKINRMEQAGKRTRAENNPEMTAFNALDYAEQQRVQEQALAQRQLDILKKGKAEGKTLEQLRAENTGFALGGRDQTNIDAAITSAQRRVTDIRTERMQDRRDEQDAKEWTWFEPKVEDFGDEKIGGFDKAVQEYMGKLNQDFAPVDTPEAAAGYTAMSELTDAATSNSTIYVYDTHNEAHLLSIRDVLNNINNVLSQNGGGNLQRAANQSNVTLPNYTQFLEGFSASVESFGSYVRQLSEIQIPEKITMVGTHVVDVRISGAAAFDGLKKDFQNMMKQEISKKMNKIWQQSGGKLGEPEAMSSPASKNTQDMFM